MYTAQCLDISVRPSSSAHTDDFPSVVLDWFFVVVRTAFEREVFHSVTCPLLACYENVPNGHWKHTDNRCGVRFGKCVWNPYLKYRLQTDLWFSGFCVDSCGFFCGKLARYIVQGSNVTVQLVGIPAWNS